MTSPNVSTTTPPSAFYAFFPWCQNHLIERGWGRLDEEAAGYLRSWGLIQTGVAPDVGASIKRLLDAVPVARITKARLIEAAA
ncbi:hypothetical protein PHMEG_0008844 [Phytophthora megakarya]|uniref:Uncharacterized protein n=1 Tax=Phytophthora megakarya TaxID=4795 RepID=A0A225WJD8_9STRA|nr:hypothetical protein PHMEG_0008844 [Phytophthora megakarya]